LSPVSASVLTVSGKGLISGQPVEVAIEPAPAGSGIRFVMQDGSIIPARLSSVVHTDRGVTLASQTQRISIVEHFLCATSLAGLSDLSVRVSGASELPLLDGSAQAWLDLLETHFGRHPVASAIDLPRAIYHGHSDAIRVYAIPDSHFKISYAVDFRHPDLQTRWARWDSRLDEPGLIVSACTFGYMDELPAMQARGLALGADAENTLGLTGSGYSRPLKYADEPIYHKMLDLIGDLSLAGLNPLALKAHVFAINAGHGSHAAFARKLLKALS
jgi:UDP-3-O-[3-hydroxymyristoyl] N-acetylglucosamine deacetylase